MSAPMGRFRIERSEMHDDPAVICNDCDETLCTVEDGDTLELIWSVGQEHECERICDTPNCDRPAVALLANSEPLLSPEYAERWACRWHQRSDLPAKVGDVLELTESTIKYRSPNGRYVWAFRIEHAA